MAVVVLVCLLGCDERSTWDAAPPTPPRLPALHALVEVDSSTGKTLTLTGPVMLSKNERTHGLMHRGNRLGDREVMLFVMETEDVQGFWMKNTYIPLDMIFVDQGGVIVGIRKNAQPRTTKTQTVEKRSRYVLEVDGGWTTRHGVKPGQHVAIQLRPQTN